MHRQGQMMFLFHRYAPVCIDADTIRKGVEEGQMAVRRALTPYAGMVPPTATSSTPESTSASETQSLQSLESLASSDLDSSLDSDEEEAEVCLLLMTDPDIARLVLTLLPL